jgi:hypothetical protein
MHPMQFSCSTGECHSCQCSWLTGVEWEKGSAELGAGKRLWSAAKSPVHTPTAVADPLPSDSRYREDLRALQARLLQPHSLPAHGSFGCVRSPRSSSLSACHGLMHANVRPRAGR